jgi:hypothetical protein
MLKSSFGIASCLGVAVTAAYLAPPDAVGLVALGSFIGNVGANLATDFFKSLHAAGARALSSRVWGLDKNEHVAKALRRAELSATVQLLRDWRKTLPSYDATKPEKIDHDFAHALQKWLDAENTEAAIDAWVARARQERSINVRSTHQFWGDTVGAKNWNRIQSQ